MHGTFDPDRQQVVVLGGQHGDSVLDDEGFTWNGAAWSMVGGAGEPEGGGGIAVWHLDADRLVMFGVSGDPGRTFLWDGSNAWDATSVVDEPPARTNAGAAYDPAGFVWLFGGRSDVQLADLWRFDGVSWEPIEPTGDVPTPRSSFGAAWDEARGELIIFGGLTSQEGAPNAVDDATYAFDGTEFHLRSQGRGPSPRYGAALTYDPVRERIVLYGGADASDTPQDDLWEWDGSTWRAMSLITGSPEAPPSYGSVFVYNALRNDVIYVPFTYEDASPPLPSHPPTWALVTLGSACDDTSNCICVDHVCCAMSPCGDGQRCNTFEAPGECAP